MEKQEAINIINNLTPKDFKNFKSVYKNDKYELYKIYFDVEDNQIAMVCCLVGNNNFVIPPIYHFTKDKEEINELFGIELLENSLAIVSSFNNDEKHLIDLNNDNFDGRKINKSRVILTFTEYFLLEDKIICINDEGCIIYDLNNKKKIDMFDSIDLYEDFMICYYIKHQIKVAMQYDYDFNIDSDKTETQIGNKIIYPIIPRNILSNKNKLIEYVSNCLNNEYNRNYLEEYYLNESERYIQ